VKKDEADLSRLIFTGGLDGDIRAWNIVDEVSEGKYMQTGGKSV
jgi:hypothetical protein